MFYTPYAKNERNVVIITFLGGIEMSLSAKPLNLEKSKEIFERAKKYTPGGLLGVRNPDFYVPGEYPMYYDRGYDGHVVDVDGNDYIDLLLGFGPIILGYNEKRITDAVTKRLEEGFTFTMCQDVQNVLLEKLCELIPCAEMGLLGKSGSDATTMAVRIARAYTKREKVLRCGYHGWHDWCVEHDTSIPKVIRDMTIEFPYGDLNALEDLLKKNKDEVAAIFLMPIQHNRSIPVLEPPKGYLEGVRKLADEYGAVLVFDEIRTGFRMSMGGAQARYGVTPDLSAFGKAMANGYAISACVGKREIIESTVGKSVFISSTFFPSSLEMVAALECIKLMEEENVLDKIWEKSTAFDNKLNDMLKQKDTPAFNAGIPVMPYVMFKDVDDKTKERTMKFYTELARRRVIISPYHHGYWAYRHTDEDYAYVLGSMEEALDATMEEFPVK